MRAKIVSTTSCYKPYEVFYKEFFLGIWKHYYSFETIEEAQKAAERLSKGKAIEYYENGEKVNN